MNTKLFLAASALFLSVGTSSLFAQSKGETQPARKTEDPRAAQHATVPRNSGTAVSGQASQPVQNQAEKPAVSTQSQMPQLHTGSRQTIEAGTKPQPKKTSSGVPSDHGKIVPREKLNEAR
jgi:hypothetical protein